MSRENTYLAQAQWEKASQLLPRKEECIQHFQEYIDNAKALTSGNETKNEQPSPEMKKVFDRFSKLMQANERLLKNAIAAQTSLVKLVMQDVWTEKKLGYGPNGRAVKNDKGMTGLAIKNDV